MKLTNFWAKVHSSGNLQPYSGSRASGTGYFVRTGAWLRPCAPGSQSGKKYFSKERKKNWTKQSNNQGCEAEAQEPTIPLKLGPMSIGWSRSLERELSQFSEPELISPPSLVSSRKFFESQIVRRFRNYSKTEQPSSSPSLLPSLPPFFTIPLSLSRVLLCPNNVRTVPNLEWERKRDRERQRLRKEEKVKVWEKRRLGILEQLWYLLLTWNLKNSRELRKIQPGEKRGIGSWNNFRIHPDLETSENWRRRDRERGWRELWHGRILGFASFWDI